MKFRKVIIYLFPLLMATAVIAFASESGAEAGSHGGGWGDIDNYKLLNFVVLVSVLFVLLKKPVKDFFSGRVEDLKKEISDLEEKKAKAEKDLQGYEKKMESLDEEVKVIVSTYVEQGKKAKKKILEEAKSSAEKLQMQAEKKIEQEFKLAKESLSKEIVDKAVFEAEKLIKTKINDQDQEKIIDDYIRKVVA